MHLYFSLVVYMSSSPLSLCHFHVLISTLHLNVGVKAFAALQKRHCCLAALSFHLNTEAQCCRNSFSSLISAHQLLYNQLALYLSVCECVWMRVQVSVQIRYPPLCMYILCVSGQQNMRKRHQRFLLAHKSLYSWIKETFLHF